MTSRMAAVAVAGIVAAVLTAPARVDAQRGSPNLQYDQHHAAAPEPAAAQKETKPEAPDMMARMKASGEQLDALVKEMNAATGQAKTDAIAKLLTALVEERRSMCEPMMAHMKHEAGGHGGGQSQTAPQEK